MTSRAVSPLLQYTSSNEDTNYELELLGQGSAHVLTIAGSGSRVIPLFSKRPKRMTVVDSSLPQIVFTKLRAALIAQMDLRAYVSFLGYPDVPMGSKERERIFSALLLDNSDRALLKDEFISGGWKPPIFYGSWEKSITRLGKLNSILLAPAPKEMFKIKDEVEFQDYLSRRFPWRRWAVITYALVLTYERLRRHGTALPKDSSSSVARYHMSAIKKLLHLGPLHANYLGQLLFMGDAKYPEGNPIECDTETFLLAKEGLKRCEVKYIHSDILDAIRGIFEPISFVSMSDVVPYLSHDKQKELLPNLREHMSADGLVVLRHYLSESDALDRTGFADVSAEYAELAAKEKTQMYRIEVLKKI